MQLLAPMLFVFIRALKENKEGASRRDRNSILDIFVLSEENNQGFKVGDKFSLV